MVLIIFVILLYLFFFYEILYNNSDNIKVDKENIILCNILMRISYKFFFIHIYKFIIIHLI